MNDRRRKSNLRWSLLATAQEVAMVRGAATAGWFCWGRRRLGVLVCTLVLKAAQPVCSREEMRLEREEVAI